ncbi:MAG TPA: membrane protein insertion efficiency factor YidD [Acidimicrobiales bacterium]|nr:membrane protein insertion efficiency factor YidD [Acidimicrobiales bacterium]
MSDEPTVQRQRGPGRRLGLGLIALYQALRSDRPSPCRYWPTCSAYAAEAIEIHGLWRGTRLALRRVLRCRPFGPHGIDLVPLKVDRGRGS